jgi:acyl carrier protein
MTEDGLKRLIIDSLQLEGYTPEMIGDDEPLFGASGLGLDSVDALELVVSLEKTLGIRIRSEDIDPATFSTVRGILGWVTRRVTAAGGAAG